MTKAELEAQLADATALLKAADKRDEESAARYSEKLDRIHAGIYERLPGIIHEFHRSQPVEDYPVSACSETYVNAVRTAVTEAIGEEPIAW